jgi:hypothetical protein
LAGIGIKVKPDPAEELYYQPGIIKDNSTIEITTNSFFIPTLINKK